jgi:hypothetical protein
VGVEDSVWEFWEDHAETGGPAGDVHDQLRAGERLIDSGVEVRRILADVPQGGEHRGEIGSI